MHTFHHSLLAFSLVTLLLGCSQDSSSDAPLVPEIKSISIEQKDNNYSVYSLQHTLKLYAQINYSDGTSDTTVNEVDWHPDDLSESTTVLAHNGDVVALKNSGEANVTVTYRDKLSSEAPKLVSIIPLEKITNLTERDNNLTLGSTTDINATTGNSVQMGANGSFVGGKSILNISSNITWTSSNTSVATIGSTGLLNVLTSGLTEINASVFNEVNGSVELNITVQ